MVQEDVFFSEGYEVRRPTGEGRRKVRGESGIAKRGVATAGFGEGEELGEVDGADDAIDVLGTQLEATEKIVFNLHRAVFGDFQTDGGAPVPFLQLLLDGEEKVLGLLLVDIELTVAGDADGPGPVDFHAGEDLGDKVPDEFREEDKFPVRPGSTRKGENSGDATGDLHKGVPGGLLLARF
jgi:hypothetical protein